MGIDQFIEADEMTLEMMQSGKALASLERNRMNRNRGKEERNEAWRAGKANESTSNAELRRMDDLIRDDNRPIIGGNERTMDTWEKLQVI